MKYLNLSDNFKSNKNTLNRMHTLGLYGETKWKCVLIYKYMHINTFQQRRKNEII